MKDIAGIFDGFYSRLILRDVLAKAFPGVLVLGAVDIAFRGEVNGIFTMLRTVAGASWLLLTAVLVVLYAAVFMTGTLVQTIGCRIGRKCPKIGLLLHPNNDFEVGLKNGYQVIDKLSVKDEAIREIVLQQRERFVVIKEATGNTGYALLISVVCLALSQIWGLGIKVVLFEVGPVGAVLGYLLGVLAACLLIDANHFHCQQQSDWEKVILEANTSS